jgi:hypothetical protein
MVEVVVLLDTTRKFFDNKEDACVHHNTYGGVAWKKVSFNPEFKPFAVGPLNPRELEHYELWQINGRPPTAQEIDDVLKWCLSPH